MGRLQALSLTRATRSFGMQAGPRIAVEICLQAFSRQSRCFGLPLGATVERRQREQQIVASREKHR